LLGTGLKCNETQCGGGGFSIDNNTTQTKLFCFVGCIVAIIATLAKASGVYILQKYEFYSLHLDRRYKFFSNCLLKSTKKGPENAENQK
jgi:hypothetical protein